MARFYALLAGALLAFPWVARAQGVLINPAGGGTPAAGAALEVRSDTKGFLPPRLTYANRVGMTNAVAGMLVYQSDSPSGQPGAGYYYYTGGGWLPLQTQGDNLGNGVAGTNVNLNGNKLVGSAGSVGVRIERVSTGSTDSNPMFDLVLTERGVELPRFNQQSRDALSVTPPPGLVFFNTDSGHLNVFDGDTWQELTTTPVPTGSYLYSAPGVHTYTVPYGVKSLHLEVVGASGSNRLGKGLSGQGGSVVADLAVQPYATLYLLVGSTDGSNGDPSESGGLSTSASSAPTANPNGEDGGGASEVRYVTTQVTSSSSLPSRTATWLVAGGGGGGGHNPLAQAGSRDIYGGDGGFYTNRSNGQLITTAGNGDGGTLLGGGGGSATAGGKGGYNGNDGGPGLGGSIQIPPQLITQGFGPGGGGGGYFGGGSGGYNTSTTNGGTGGGGGGGSYALKSANITNVVHTAGVQTGNGYIRLTVNP